jgi:hypothetical protein
VDYEESGYQLTLSATVALDLRPVLGLGAVSSSVPSYNCPYQHLFSTSVKQTLAENVPLLTLFTVAANHEIGVGRLVTVTRDVVLRTALMLARRGSSFNNCPFTPR